MTAFWKNLQQLAHGQLFNGGYLSADVARERAAAAEKAQAARTASPDPLRRPPHTQIAAYR